MDKEAWRPKLSPELHEAIFGKRRAPKLTAEQIADKIYSLIPYDQPISMCALAAKAHVTMAQVARGIAYLRDTFPTDSLPSGPRGVQWTLDDEKVKKYWNARARTGLTQIRRAYTGDLKPWLDQRHPELAKVWNKAITRLIEDIQDVMFK